MRKLLVAIDGSDSSMRALDYAINLVNKQAGTELHVLTVHPEPILYGEIQVYASREKMEEMQRVHSMDILKPAIQRLEASRVPYKSEILIGDTAPTIVKRANELNCDGIIIGSRGMTAIANLVMGSVATKVVHLATVPVTLVK
jgi:nucleotide-binding universal stress UspA family protein